MRLSSISTPRLRYPPRRPGRHLPNSKALALCRAQSAGTQSHYPWAVVANNLTLMLADVLELRANQFAESRKGYWGVFDRRVAFFEVRLLWWCGLACATRRVLF